MDNLIIELVEDCKLVKIAYERNNSFWGNDKNIKIKYVWLDGVFKRCYDGWYIVHDGDRIKDVLTPYQMERINHSDIYLI